MTSKSSDPRVDKLRQARAADSTAKQQRALDTVQRLLAGGQRVTFTDVARSAAVSTWFTYNNAEVAATVRHAQADQTENGLHVTPGPAERVSAASLRTDLEHARHQIRSITAENTRLRQALGRRLGAELEQTDPAELLKRLRDVEQHNRDLTQQLTASTDQDRRLTEQLKTSQDDLAAARETLRRTIRAVPAS